MADTSKPTGKPAKNQVVLTASLDAEGNLQLTSDGLQDGAISIPAGEDLEVTIRDGAGVRMYASTVPNDGSDATCWVRDASKAEVSLRFNGVIGETLNAVFASEGAAAGASNKIKYGPVITVKPKG